jgi:hypothetical protein
VKRHADLSLHLSRDGLCEYARLRQRYEASLRQWGQALQASQGTIGDPPAKLAVQTEQKALEERNAANNRMCCAHDKLFGL